MLVRIAVSSLLARKFTMMLTVISIAVSFFVLLGINHIKSEMRHSFGRTVSGVDLIVGARSSSINLLLYSVFRVGNATNNISWDSYVALTESKNVAWSIPISLGDSHKGFRVMGTTNDYFSHYRYGNKQALAFQQGAPFTRLYDVVLGAGVAASLGYELGTELVIAHGVGKTSFKKHQGYGFRVTGILVPTGTPIDQTIHVTLPAVDSIHGGGVSHDHNHDAHGHNEHAHDTHEHDHDVHGHNEHAHDEHNHDTHEHDHDAHSHNEHDHDVHAQNEHAHDEHQTDADTLVKVEKGQNPLLDDIHHEPKSITAFMAGLNSKIAVLGQLRRINEYKKEPLLAIMPGVALSEMWQIMKVVEKALAIIAFLVLIAALFGLVTMLLASMNERQREIAVLRASGASAGFIIVLIEFEAIMLVLAGIALGLIALITTMALGQDLMSSQFGIFISSIPDWGSVLMYTGIVVGLTFILALIPALISYRRSMIHGLTVNY